LSPLFSMHASIGQHLLVKVIISAIFNPSPGCHLQPQTEAEISKVELGSGFLDSRSLEQVHSKSILGFLLLPPEHPFSALLVSGLIRSIPGMNVKETEGI